MDNKLKYTEFCSGRNDIPLFHQPWWLDVVTNGGWSVAISTNGSGDICGAMPYSISKKYLKLAALQPLLTPYLGVLFFYPPDLTKRISRYSFENEHSRKIIQNIPGYLLYQRHSFCIDFQNWYSFYFDRFEQTTRYTYILKEIKNQDLILSEMSNTLKRQIRNAREECSILESGDIHQVFELTREALEGKNIKFPVSREMLDHIDLELSKRGQRKIMLARNDAGDLLSGLYLCWDAKQAYLLGLGMSRGHESANSVKLLIYESIVEASKHVDIYNFEGSMIPGVERLYRSFGGEMTPYFEIKKYKNRLVRNLLGLINY